MSFVSPDDDRRPGYVRDSDEAEAERASRQYAMRFGPREYTDEQARFIEQAVANRKPLPETPVPIEDDE